MTARPPLGLAFRSLLRAEFTALGRGGRVLALNIAVPVVVLVLTWLETQGHTISANSAATLVGVAITVGLLSADVMGYPLSVARHRESGVFQRLRVAPIPTWAIMGSRLVMQLAVNIVIVLAVAIIGAVLHGLPLGAAQYLLLLPAALIGGAVFLGIGQALAGLLPSTALVNAAGRVIYVALVLAGFLGPTGSLGKAFESAEAWSPMGSTARLFHTALVRGDWTTTDTAATLVSLGYILVFAAVGIRFVRWDTTSD